MSVTPIHAQLDIPALIMLLKAFCARYAKVYKIYSYICYMYWHSFRWMVQYFQLNKSFFHFVSGDVWHIWLRRKHWYVYEWIKSLLVFASPICQRHIMYVYIGSPSVLSDSKLLPVTWKNHMNSRGKQVLTNAVEVLECREYEMYGIHNICFSFYYFCKVIHAQNL